MIFSLRSRGVSFSCTVWPTTATLLERAASLYEPGDPARLALLPELGEALMEAGDLVSRRRTKQLGE